MNYRFKTRMVPNSLKMNCCYCLESEEQFGICIMYASKNAQKWP